MKLRVIFCLLLFTFCLSCTEEPPPTLTFKEREMVDSLFQLQVDSLRPHYDSLCQAKFDSAVQHNVDSMMEVRLNEIREYLERMRQENQ